MEEDHDNTPINESDTDSDNESQTEEQTTPLTPYERIQQKMPNEKTSNNKIMGEKASKGQVKANRELGDLEHNQILDSRLRSSSGKVYFASVTVEAASVTGDNPGQKHKLTPVIESDLPDSNMCLKDDCCKNTSTLISLINKLQDSVDGVVNKLSDQESAAKTAGQDIQEVKQDCFKNTGDIRSLEHQLQETQSQLKIVQNLVICQDEQIGFLKSKITEMQQREMSSNLVITGIIETKDEKPLQSFNNFVQNELQLQELIPANKAFRVGSGTARPLIVELRHPESKRKIFGNASNLKGKSNSKGKPFFVSDHLPEELNEHRQHMNELFAENKKKPADKKQNMLMQRGNLLIDDESYEKAIIAPSAAEILDPSAPLVETIDQLDIIKGIDGVRGKSRFVSYAVAVQDCADINAAYLKLKSEFTQATHISCAFRLPGFQTHINQDYYDDGEWGCGRTMLKVLKKEQILNIAVFLIRFYGGKHLGTARFDVFREFTSEAINQLILSREKDGKTSLSQPTAEDDATDQHVDTDWSNQQDWSADKNKTD